MEPAHFQLQSGAKAYVVRFFWDTFWYQHGGLVARHDQFSGHRVSITAVTSSWSDGTAGPLGLCIPRGMMSDAEIQSFNANHRGRDALLSARSFEHIIWMEKRFWCFWKASTHMPSSVGSTNWQIQSEGSCSLTGWSSGLDLAREAWSSSVMSASLWKSAANRSAREIESWC